MPTSNPSIADLLGTSQFRAAGAPPLAVRPPAAASAPARAAFGRPGTAPQTAQPPAASPAPQNLAPLMAALRQLGLAPPPPPKLPPELQTRIAQKLSEMGDDATPMWISPGTLADQGVDAATLSEAFAALGLAADPTFSARGGVLIAKSPEVLQQAVAARDKSRSVPIHPVTIKVPRRRRVSAHPAPRSTQP